MIIPQFELSQTTDHVVLRLRLPYVKVSKSEFFIEGNKFQFYLKPYNLKVTLENRLKDAEEPNRLVYDPKDYNLTVYLLKAEKGEEFTNLNMISLLLSKNKQIKKKEYKKKKSPLIQVLSSIDYEESKEESVAIHQVESLFNKYKYGFNNQYHDVFESLEEELFEIGVLDPGCTPNEQRSIILRQQVTQDFDKEHYLFDLWENEDVDHLIKEPFNIEDGSNFTYTSDEQKVLSELRMQESLLHDTPYNLWLQILDVCYCALYELRVMGGEFGCESAATINRTSGVLCGFVGPDSEEALLVQCYERCLCFPLVRSFELCEGSRADLVWLVKEKGQVGLLKLLMAVRKYIMKYSLIRVFKQSEPRYLLNDLFVDGMLLFIQGRDFEMEMGPIAQTLDQCNPQKNELVLGLEKLEQESIVNDQQ